MLSPARARPYPDCRGNRRHPGDHSAGPLRRLASERDRSSGRQTRWARLQPPRWRPSDTLTKLVRGARLKQSVSRLSERIKVGGARCGHGDDQPLSHRRGARHRYRSGYSGPHLDPRSQQAARPGPLLPRPAQVRLAAAPALRVVEFARFLATSKERSIPLKAVGATDER